MDGWMDGLNRKEEDKKRMHTWYKDKGRQPFSYMHINMYIVSLSMVQYSCTDRILIFNILLFHQARQ